jgi:gliding motility-associated-like protein
VSACAGEVYVLPGGTPVTTSGTYTDAFFTSEGCDSIIETTVVFYPEYFIELAASICEGETYILPSGITVTDAGLYIDSLSTVNGCDSVITMDLTVLPVHSAVIQAVICAGESYQLPGGAIVSSSGVYTDQFTNRFGCDSLITTTLEVLPSYSYGISVQRCEGMAYTLPGGATVTAPGSYTDSLVTSAGCDSVIQTTVTFVPEFFVAAEGHICEGASFLLPSGVYTSDPGTYTVTLPSFHGCDSTVEMTLAVSPSFSSEETFSICQGGTVVLPNGLSASSDTTVVLQYTTVAGCDSIYIYRVEILENRETELHYEMCGTEPVMIDGQIYEESGTYIIQHAASNGCDSTVMLHVALHAPFNEFIDTFICEGASLQIAGQELTAAGTYVLSYTDHFGCDSVYTILVETGPPPYIRARGDTMIARGSSVLAYLQEENRKPLSYSWYINDSMRYENVRTFTDRYYINSYVHVRVTDSTGCSAEDGFLITMDEGCPDGILFVPNIISPNYDNANDVFTIRNPDGVLIREVSIFNRWGEMVYQAPDFSDPWDGTFRGQACNPDVYTYYILGTCASGSNLLKKGNITLLR